MPVTAVEVEEVALAEARQAASPDVIDAQVRTLTAETIAYLDGLGRLPASRSARRALRKEIAASAREQFAAALTARIAFHERALVIAKSWAEKTPRGTWHLDGLGTATSKPRSASARDK